MPSTPSRSIKSEFLQVKPEHGSIGFCFVLNLSWFFRLRDIPNSSLVLQLQLTLKHKLVLLVVPQFSGHLGSGVVVGSGGRVTPSAQCLHTNFDFSSQLKTSHRPPAIPVFMATHPAFLPALNTQTPLSRCCCGLAILARDSANPTQIVWSHLRVWRKWRGEIPWHLAMYVCSLESLFTFPLWPQLNYDLKGHDFDNILYF